MNSLLTNTNKGHGTSLINHDSFIIFVMTKKENETFGTFIDILDY